MAWKSILKVALRLKGTVILGGRWDGDDLILRVRCHAGQAQRCPDCRVPCGRYDRATSSRRWRSIDLGTIKLFLEADTYRVYCPAHGVKTAYVPWARHGSRSTQAFEDTACWLVKHCSQTAVATYLRTTWRSIGAVIHRRVSRADWPVNTLQLKRIGIDEISYRRGQKYLTIVVDHDTGLLVWSAPGRSKEVVGLFFDQLGPQRCREVELVTRDAATWISTVITERCPQAVQCMDPFHVVAWATKAVDNVRRATYRQLQYSRDPLGARAIKGSRWILLRNRPDLNDAQRRTLAGIQRDNKDLYRAYLLKELLRDVFQLEVHDALRQLDRWLVWARRSQLRQFVKVAKTIAEQREAIRATLIHRETQGRVEAVNTAIRLITRQAYGFHSPHALIALTMLKLGGLCPPLPGRTTV